MKLTVDTLTKYNPTESEVIETIEKVASEEKDFTLLEYELGTYIQCTGSGTRFTVEKRYVFENGFKHVVIGKSGNVSPLNVIWETINSSVGPIRVHTTEVLTINEVKLLFILFLHAKPISSDFIERNITKYFKNE